MYGVGGNARLVKNLEIGKISPVGFVDVAKHSIDENRFIDIGLSERLRLLIVVYTERNSKIRLISSRKATPNEEKIYAQH